MSGSGRLLMAILIAEALAPACTRVPAALSPEERALGAAVGFPEPMLLRIRQAGQTLRQLEGTDEGGKPVKAAGVTIEVREKAAAPTVRRLQEAVGAGHVVFISERHFGIDGQPDKVAVLRSQDPYDALRTMGTNGWNYDIGPEMVIQRLKEWDARFGITLVGAGFDWVEAELKRQPDDLPAFAQEVYRFCPDVVDQGAESVEALAAEMKRTRVIYLWWD